MAEVALGIDVGTSGLRIAAVEESGHVAALASASIGAPLTLAGKHQQDPALWWKALEQAFSQLDLAGHSPVALAIDGTSGTILAIDASGNPVGVASMYNDLAEPADVEAVRAVAPPDSAALGSSSPLARALQMQEGTARILHQADWLMGRLCGRFDLSDENNALKSGYDPVSRQWPAWIGSTGLDLDLLPQVVPAATLIGQILPAPATAFKLPPSLVLVSGTTDGCAAFFASGASEEGDGVTSLGTSLTLKLLSSKPIFAPQYGIYSHRIGDQWLAGGASNSGGAVLQKFFTLDQLLEMTPRLNPETATDLTYYPLLQPGERFPIADPALAPVLEPRPADDVVFYQALLEGMADIEAIGFRRLNELGASPLRTIRCVGGGAANVAWTAIRLRKLGVPARKSLSEHAAVGTALLAWSGFKNAH